MVLTVVITVLSTLFVYGASSLNIMSEKLAKPVGDLLLFLLSSYETLSDVFCFFIMLNAEIFSLNWTMFIISSYHVYNSFDITL